MNLKIPIRSPKNGLILGMEDHANVTREQARLLIENRQVFEAREREFLEQNDKEFEIVKQVFDLSNRLASAHGSEHRRLASQLAELSVTMTVSHFNLLVKLRQELLRFWTPAI